MIDEKVAAKLMVGWMRDALTKAVAAERARCAAVCREVAVAYTEAEYPYRAAGALECAEAIERGAVGR